MCIYIIVVENIYVGGANPNIFDTMLHNCRFLFNISGKSQLRIGTRCAQMFSSTPPEKEDESQLQKYKPQLTQAVIVGGIGITIYGLSSFMWDVTYGILKLFL